MKYQNGDRVQFHSTSDDELDSITGTVIGITADDVVASHYIVLLDMLHSKFPWDAISITEHCLKPIIWETSVKDDDAVTLHGQRDTFVDFIAETNGALGPTHNI